MGKPIHPATVHFPIAFLLLGFGLDALHAAGDRVPAALAAHLPPAHDLTRASYYLIFLGLASSLPAVATGVAQNIKMIAKQGLYEPDGKTVKAKVKAAIAHAVVIDISLAIAGYAWYARYSRIQDSIAGKLGVQSALPYAPEGWVVAAQALAAGLLMFGSNIGGALTYNYGVGFSSLSTAKDVKAKKLN